MAEATPLPIVPIAPALPVIAADLAPVTIALCDGLRAMIDDGRCVPPARDLLQLAALLYSRAISIDNADYFLVRGIERLTIEFSN